MNFSPDGAFREIPFSIYGFNVTIPCNIQDQMIFSKFIGYPAMCSVHVTVFKIPVIFFTMLVLQLEYKSM